MILHTLTRKAAGAFLGISLAVGGVDVAEGQEKDLGGKDGKAWVLDQTTRSLLNPIQAFYNPTTGLLRIPNGPAAASDYPGSEKVSLVGNTKLKDNMTVSAADLAKDKLVDIKSAEIEVVHYNLQTRQVVPFANVRSHDISKPGEKPVNVAYDVTDPDRKTLGIAHIEVGLKSDGIISDDDLKTDLRSSGYRYQEVLPPGYSQPGIIPPQRQAAPVDVAGTPQNPRQAAQPPENLSEAEIKQARDEVRRIQQEQDRLQREAEQQARAAEQAARAAAQPSQMSKADFMDALDRGAAAADRKGFESLKGDQNQWRNDYRAMRDIETALKSDPVTVTAAMRKAMEGPNADVINSYADAIAANGNRPLSPAAVAEHQLVLQNRMQGSGERELKQQESAPAAAVAAQPRREAPASAPAAPAVNRPGISAVDFQRSLPPGPDAATTAALRVGAMTDQQFDRVKSTWERVHPGSGAALQELRNNPPDNPMERANAVNKLQAAQRQQAPQVERETRATPAPADGVDRNSSEYVRNLPRVPADQGRNVEAEIAEKSMDRLRARNPGGATLLEGYMAQAQAAGEGVVRNGTRPATVKLPGDDATYVIWEKKGADGKPQYHLLDAKELYDEGQKVRRAMETDGVIHQDGARLKKLQDLADSENAVRGMGGRAVDPANPPAELKNKVDEAVQRHRAEPRASNEANPPTLMNAVVDDILKGRRTTTNPGGNTADTAMRGDVVINRDVVLNERSRGIAATGDVVINGDLTVNSSGRRSSPVSAPPVEEKSWLSEAGDFLEEKYESFADTVTGLVGDKPKTPASPPADNNSRSVTADGPGVIAAGGTITVNGQDIPKDDQNRAIINQGVPKI